MKKILATLSVCMLVLSTFNNTSVYAVDTTVTMSITAGTVTYWGPASLTYANTLTTSFGAQTLQQQFTGAANYFWVQDLKGADSGYNTTLQMSGHLVAGSYIISWSNVSFQAAGAITTVSGSANSNVVLDGGTASFQALNTSRNFVKRNAAANNGLIWYYAANIELKVDVPANKPAGSYAGTLVYTLIEN